MLCTPTPAYPVFEVEKINWKHSFGNTICNLGKGKKCRGQNAGKWPKDRILRYFHPLKLAVAFWGISSQLLPLLAQWGLFKLPAKNLLKQSCSNSIWQDVWKDYTVHCTHILSKRVANPLRIGHWNRFATINYFCNIKYKLARVESLGIQNQTVCSTTNIKMKVVKLLLISQLI